MNDKRELLELAAKAAGYTIDGDVLRNPKSEFEYDGWNPLEDDGDALRLAVRLGILVHVTHPAYAEAIHENIRAIEHTGNDLSGCIYAATRLAIVRVAAETGRNMK